MDVAQAPSLHDEVYGTHEIPDPVLWDLIASAPVQRLRGIHQSGAAWLVRPRRDVSRYEHSVGTMLLIRRVGGSLEEQVAGLLHDVPHTAFSHVADRVFENTADEYHERHLERVVRASEIPSILARHGIAVERVLDKENWPILERPAPALCADRIDYALRDLVREGKVAPDEVRQFLDDLMVFHGRMVHRTPEVAAWFVHAYVAVVDGLFMDPLECYAQAVLAQVLRLALRVGVLAEADLFLDDAAVLDRLRAAAPAHSELGGLLAGLHENVQVEASDGKADLRLAHKPRTVDPLVLSADGTAVPLSVLSTEVRMLNERVLAKACQGVGLKVLHGVVDRTPYPQV
jgi:HD superfamily phosphohydrolase